MLYRTSVLINAVDLSTLSGIAINNHEFMTSMPVRNLVRSKLARADLSVLTSAEYVEKTILIHGIVAGSNRDDIEVKFETMKALLQIPESNIEVTQSGDQVNYIGTLNSISSEPFGRHLKFTLGFLCANPIGYHRDLTTALNVTNTEASESYDLTILGSYKARPVIRVTIDSLTGGTDKTIQVINQETLQGISVTRTWSTNDVLTVDSYRRSVDVNNSAVDYGGVFPSFFPGAREFQYIDDLTTRSVDILIQYNKAYA